MALKTLTAKANSPIIDSGDFLAFLASHGVTVNNDTVIANADGTVEVDTEATTGLDDAWAAYEPPAPAPPPPTLRETLLAGVATVTTVDGMRVFLTDSLIPALIPIG